MNDMEIRGQHDIEKLTPEQLGGEIRLLTPGGWHSATVFRSDIVFI